MKVTLTGVNQALRPDLERKLIVSDDLFSLTIDQTDEKGGCRLNQTLRVKRRQSGYRITAKRVYDKYPNEYQIEYRISGAATHTLMITTMESTPLVLTTSVRDHQTGETIEGPAFTLDAACVPAWRALVQTMIAETDLDDLVAVSRTITNNRFSCYGMTPNMLALKLTTPPYP